jgi:hypothetical protein
LQKIAGRDVEENPAYGRIRLLNILELVDSYGYCSY